MACSTAQSSEIWALARSQRWVLARWQLAEAGITRSGIQHRLSEGRLHLVHKGVYAVGRSELSREGEWAAALLACGWKRPNAPLLALSHRDAGHNHRVGALSGGPVNVSLRAAAARRARGIRAHRRTLRRQDIVIRNGFPTTSITLTLVDLAQTEPEHAVEEAIAEADRLGRISPPALLRALEREPSRPGKAKLRQILTRHSLELPTTELERLFLPIAKRAGLPAPITQHDFGDRHPVDFWFPSLGLVVETDGLTYHRTAAQQAKDRRADQRHQANGRTPLRFAHYQVKFEAGYVEAVLRRVARRGANRPQPPCDT